MSTQIHGTAIRRPTGALVTEDGQHALLRLEQHSGGEMVLAIPVDQLTNLITLVAQAATGARNASGGDPAVTEAFLVQELRVQYQQGEPAAVLDFKLPNGAQLAFRLPAGSQQALIDQLALTMAPPATDPSQVN